MNDMRSVIIPKSDQLNADDLISGTRTITITGVSIRPGTEQPVTISYEGDGGKPYKPCKVMCRVMVHCWGPDANKYVGGRLTLYRDPGVKWGGLAVGGIRISHMSGIERATTIALTETKGSKKPFTVKPLANPEPAKEPVVEPPRRTAKMFLDELERNLFAAQESMDAKAEVTAILADPDVKRAQETLTNGYKARLETLIGNALAAIADPNDSATEDGDDFPGDRP